MNVGTSYYWMMNKWCYYFPLASRIHKTTYIMRVLNPYRWCRSTLLHRRQCKWYENPFLTGVKWIPGSGIRLPINDMNISEILLRGGIRNVNLVCKDHYFPVSRVDFVGVVIGKLNNYQRYLITTLKIYDHNKL